MSRKIRWVITQFKKHTHKDLPSSYKSQPYIGNVMKLRLKIFHHTRPRCSCPCPCPWWIFTHDMTWHDTTRLTRGMGLLKSNISMSFSSGTSSSLLRRLLGFAFGGAASSKVVASFAASVAAAVVVSTTSWVAATLVSSMLMILLLLIYYIMHGYRQT